MSKDPVLVSSNAPAFVLKLWRLVEDPGVNDLISWSKAGTAFAVHDPVVFAKDVLPYYFKHSNFTSFVRQLNMYGFKKLVSTDHGGIKADNPEWEFHHQYFVQGKLDLLENIKRKVHPEEKKIKTEDVSNILEDVKQLHAKHGAVQTQLETIKLENEMLWQEISDLRIRHKKQQHVLNKLIKFLILMYGRKGVGNQKRLAIQSAHAPVKQQRMSSPPLQVEELENLKYVVESPKAASSIMFPLDSKHSNAGPQITLLPDEPLMETSSTLQGDPQAPMMLSATASRGISLVPESASAMSPPTIGPVSTPQSNSVCESLTEVLAVPSTCKTQVGGKAVTSTLTASASQVKRPKPGAGKKKNGKSKTAEDTSLKLTVPSMVSLSREPVLDFSPSIFENIGQIFPSDTNISNLMVEDTLEELQNSYDQSNSVVLKRGTSTDKDFIDQDVDHINSSLDSLQNVLAGGHYNFDPEILSQLFNYEDDRLAIDQKPLPAIAEDKKNRNEDAYGEEDRAGSSDDLPPFSPGMFLNEVGEPSTEKDLDSEDNSLLSYSKE